MPKIILLAICMAAFSAAADQSEERILADISGKLSAQLDTLRAWSADNSRQAGYLLEQSDAAMAMAQHDHIKPDARTWSAIDDLNEQSLGLLHATQSLWESYGNFNSYLASVKKAQAWQSCSKQQHCSFRDAVSNMDTNSVEVAVKAAKSAELSQKNIAEQIKKLEAFAFEARNSEGLAAGIDALSKVNAASAASLVDLSNGVNTMLSIQAHESADAHSRTLAKEDGSRAVMEGGEFVKSPHYNIKINK